MAKQKTLIQKRPRLWRAAVTVILLGIGIGVLIMHHHTISQGVDSLRDANTSWMVASLFGMLVTFCLAAGIYKLLALHHLRYLQIVVIELAATFANRLLPAGLGGLGLHGLYLYRQKHTPAQATTVVSTNNVLGIIAHCLLLLVVVLIQPDVFGKLVAHYDFEWWYGLVVLLVIALVIAVPRVRRKLGSFAKNLLESLRSLRPSHVFGAVCLAVILTMTYTFILFASARGIDIHLDILHIFIVFSIGMLVGTATPTPGGLVGTEAGLFAGFVGYGISPANATAAVLLFRLVTYWLPIIPGVIALLAVRGRKLV